MKIISWNVNGIRAVLNKGFLQFVKKEDPNILCVQETKAQAHQVDVDKALEPYGFHHWNSAEKNGYAGTALFSKERPVSVHDGINISKHDKEGRVITAEFSKFYLVNVYVPNSGNGLVRLGYRKGWDTDFLNYLKHLEKKKPVVVCGDFNVAHTPLDLANPKSNYNKTAGYTQTEIDGFTALIDQSLVDTFRMFVKEGGHYTFWSTRTNARARNIGWRIDYFLVSKSFAGHVKKSGMLPNVMGSDHCPIVLELSH